MPHLEDDGPGIEEEFPGKNGNFVSASQGRQSWEVQWNYLALRLQRNCYTTRVNKLFFETMKVTNISGD